MFRGPIGPQTKPITFNKLTTQLNWPTERLGKAMFVSENTVDYRANWVYFTPVSVMIKIRVEFAGIDPTGVEP